MTAEQLFNNYEPVDRKNDFEVIGFCEKNFLTIQNLDEGDNNKLTLKRNLLSDYGYALAKSGQSSKAIPILTEAIRLHEKHSDFKDNKNKLDGYQYIVFLLGESFYKTSKIHQAKEVFEKLMKLSPDNENYKSWVIQTTNYKRKKIKKVISIAFIVWLLISVPFMNKLGQPAFILTGLALAITGSALDIKNYLIKRKYR